MATLRNWFWTGHPRGAAGGLLVIWGEVHGHPRAADGTVVATSPVVEVQGRTIVTASGTRYQLDEPSPEYVAWLAALGATYDPDAPLRLLVLLGRGG